MHFHEIKFHFNWLNNQNFSCTSRNDQRLFIDLFIIQRQPQHERPFFYSHFLGWSNIFQINSTNSKVFSVKWVRNFLTSFNDSWIHVRIHKRKSYRNVGKTMKIENFLLGNLFFCRLSIMSSDFTFPAGLFPAVNNF